MFILVSSRGYAGSDSSQLFGLPLFVPVPRKGCDYDTLYNCTVAQMTLVYSLLTLFSVIRACC